MPLKSVIKVYDYKRRDILTEERGVILDGSPEIN